MTTETQLIKVDQSKPVGNGETVTALLGQYKKSFEVIGGPTGLDIPRLMRTVLLQAQQNPKLLECTGASLLGAFLLSVQLGLDIAAKEAYLIPFKQQVTLIPDYRGLAKLVRNTGKVTQIKPFVVYKQDVFEYEEGSTPIVIHKPSFDHPFDDKDIIGAYCRSTFADGSVEVHFIHRTYIDKVRKNAPGGNSDMWTKHFPEACKKTAVRSACKSLPQSVSLVQALDVDTRALMDRPQRVRVVEDATGLLSAELEPEPQEVPERPQGNVLDRVVKDAVTAKVKGAETATSVEAMRQKEKPAANVPDGWVPPDVL